MIDYGDYFALVDDEKDVEVPEIYKGKAQRVDDKDEFDWLFKILYG